MSETFASGICAARVKSLANGVAGLLKAAVLSIHAIGQAYASLAQISPKSGVKQVNRWLGNNGIHLDTLMALWCKHIVADSAELCIVIDWTDCDHDDLTMLSVYQVKPTGRTSTCC